MPPLPDALRDEARLQDSLASIQGALEPILAASMMAGLALSAG